MSVTEREYIDEESFDAAAQELLTVPLEQLRLADNAWKKFDKPCPPGNTYVYAVQLLGDIREKRVLDYGCGDGSFSVILAKRGGLVWGFDTSGISIQVAQRRAAANDVGDRVHFEKMSAYKIGYEDETFDLVIGLDILHHVEIGKTAPEIARVLKKTGRAIFLEPLAASKGLQFIRRFVPVAVAIHEGSQERQLTYQDVDDLARHFSRVACKEFQIFSRLDRVVGNKPIRRWLNLWDHWLLETFPALRRYARQIVIELWK